MEKKLSIVLLSDNKYHFIGSIKEKKLYNISIKGFCSYNEALIVLKKYNYKLFN